MLRHILPYIPATSAACIAAALLAGCSTDDYAPEPAPEAGGLYVSVDFKIATLDAASRSSGNEADQPLDADKDPTFDDDGIYNWIVFLYEDDNTSNKQPAYIISSSDKNADDTSDASSAGVYVDQITTYIKTGQYTAYSFANIPSSYFGAWNTTTTSATDSDGNTVTTYAYTGAPTASDIEAMTYEVYANGYDGSYTLSDNTSSLGIPMSNKETAKITAQNADNTKGTMTVTCAYDNDADHLHVIRMYACIEVQIQNHTQVDELEIEYVTLNYVTANGQTINLLPTNINDTGHCKPNVVGTPEVTVVQKEVNATISKVDNKDTSGNPQWYEDSENSNDDKTHTVRFYVNESIKPDNLWNLFELSVYAKRQSNNGGSEITEHRYALISNENDEWNYIARNDYRIIPVMLQEYKIDFIVVDFPAIGVYPAAIKNEDGLWTATFHEAGHFHLIPVVTSMSNPDLAITVTNATLTPVNENGTSAASNAYDNLYESSTDTADGSDNGGVPVWDSNATWDGYLDSYYFYGSGLFFGKFAATANAPATAYYTMTATVDTSIISSGQISANLALILSP